MAKHTASVSQQQNQTDAPPPGDPPPPVPISVATGSRKRAPYREAGIAYRDAVRRICAADLSDAQRVVGMVIVGEVTSWSRLTDRVRVEDIQARTGYSRRTVQMAIAALVAQGVIERVPAKNGRRFGAEFTISPAHGDARVSTTPPAHGDARVSTTPPAHGDARVNAAPRPVEKSPPAHGDARVTRARTCALREGPREVKPLNTGPSSGPGDLEKIDVHGNGLAFVAAHVLALLSDQVGVTICRGLTPRQAVLVSEAWRRNDYEVRHALGAVETADDPLAYLVGAATRITAASRE